MVFKFAYFVELTKGFQPAKLQCCKLSGSSFTEGLQKHSGDVIMTSCDIFRIRNFHIFCEADNKLSTYQVSNPSVI